MKNYLKKAMARVARPAIARVETLDRRLDALEEHARHVAADHARFSEEVRRLDELVSSDLSRSAASEDLIGRVLAEQRARLDQIEASTEQTRKLLEMRVLPQSELTLDMLDEKGAWYLNRATGWRGFAAKAGVYVNDAINLVHEPGSVSVANVNERIAELPFVFGKVLGVPAPARVLDVGCGESPVALSLATLGYQVTAVDPRGYAFEHPNIEVRAMGAEELPDSEPYDVAVVLSAIEHVGIGHYEGTEPDPDADIAVLRRVHDLVKPEGLLVLTTPFGRAAQDDVQRIYDPERLERLLEGWKVREVVVLERTSGTEWNVVGSEITVPDGDAFRVIMVAADRL